MQSKAKSKAITKIDKALLCNAYYQGMREAVALYAHWHDGVQYVGTVGKTLEQSLSDIDQQEHDVLIQLGKEK
jgi:hypothetical protein